MPGGEDLIAVTSLRIVRVAERRGDERAEARGVRVVVPGRGERLTQMRHEIAVTGDSKETAREPTEGKEGDRRAVRKTLSRCDRCPRIGEAFGELLDQPGLASARGGRDRHELRSALDEGAIRDEVQLREIALTSEERYARASFGEAIEQNGADDRLALALHDKGLLVGEPERRDRPAGTLANQDRSGLGVLLQAGTDVHRVAGHEEITGVRLPRRDDLTGVHADPQGERCGVRIGG